MREKIGVLGYDYPLTLKALQEIAENDMDSKPRHIRQTEVTMEDDTIYFALSGSLKAIMEKTRGMKLDQIIIVDDFRWNIYQKRYDEIQFLKVKLSENRQSLIPYGVRVLQYEW